MILLGSGVDINDIVNGRHVRITGSGQLQSIISNCGVDVFKVNANLVIANDGKVQSLYNCLVNSDNVNCGILSTGETKLLLTP